MHSIERAGHVPQTERERERERDALHFMQDSGKREYEANKERDFLSYVIIRYVDDCEQHR